MTDPQRPRFGRIVRRHRPAGKHPPSLASLRPGEIWALLRSYLGLGRMVREAPIRSPEDLARYLEERASFVGQTSLYGYLRTRAGMRYPELFDDDPFVESINIAKWHVWLDCLSDLSVHAGGRLAHRVPHETPRIGRLMPALVGGILEAAGEPAEAGLEFAGHAARVRRRLARTDWLAVGDQEAAFTESPAGLVRWAPIVDELKRHDEEIVRNSVRFRWQEIRRELARTLDARAVLEAAPD